MTSASLSADKQTLQGRDCLASVLPGASGRNKRDVWLLVALGCVSFALQAGIFWQIAQLANALIVNQGESLLSGVPDGQWLNGFALLAFSWLGVLWWRDHLVENLDLRVKQGLQQQLQQKLAVQQVALVRQNSNYFWQQCWLDHIPAISDHQVRFTPQKIIAVLVPVMTLGIMFSVNWLVAVVTLISLPVLPLFMVLIGKGTGKLHSKHFQALERLGSQFTDRLKNLSTLHIFNATEQHQARLMQSEAQLNRRTLDIVRLAFLNTSVLDFFATISVALVAVFVGFSLLGEISIGPKMGFTEGLFLLLLCPSLYNELKFLGSMYHMKSKAEAAEAALGPILVSKTVPKKTVETLQTPKFGPLCWRNFNIEDTGLSCTELSIFPGNWIRLQGASGSGKTTLFEAMIGMRPASHRLPGKCAMMTQQALVIPGSVRENLTLGSDTDIAQERLLQIIDEVGLSGWLHSLPQKLDTFMGEIPPLSGGQAQRLSLARLLLCDADIYLLDEPTAHLTDELHHNIAQLIARLLAHKTVIWATHKTIPKQWFSNVWCIENSVLSVTRTAVKEFAALKPTFAKGD